MGAAPKIPWGLPPCPPLSLTHHLESELQSTATLLPHLQQGRAVRRHEIRPHERKHDVHCRIESPASPDSRIVDEKLNQQPTYPKHNNTRQHHRAQSVWREQSVRVEHRTNAEQHENERDEERVHDKNLPSQQRQRGEFLIPSEIASEKDVSASKRQQQHSHDLQVTVKRHVALRNMKTLTNGVIDFSVRTCSPAAAAVRNQSDLEKK